MNFSFVTDNMFSFKMIGPLKQRYYITCTTLQVKTLLF